MSARPDGDFTVVENIIAVPAALFGVMLIGVTRSGDAARALFAGAAR